MSDLNVENSKDSKSCICTVSEDSDVPVQSQQKQITKPDNSKEPRNHIRDSIKCKMYIFCRDFCFLFVIMFTYFKNSSPKISKSPHAFPFYPPGSLVKDWYHGELSEAIELASESDLSFVMFYAPWDAESQAVKREFLKTAQHMHTHVHFAAINCWHPGSECRQQYSQVYSWPILMVYPVHGRGIQYRGPRKFEHMLKFLQLVASPIKRINQLQEISEYLSTHDAVVVGYMDARLGSNDFGVYYRSALRFLERDPFREIEFLIYTGKKEYDLPYLQLYLWNETLNYPKSNLRKPETVTSWISDNLHQVSLWASLSGTKSQSLATYLQPGPALILFTPRNPLYDYNDYYKILHDVALDYYNCNNNIGINTINLFSLLSRKENQLNYKWLESNCLPVRTTKINPTVVTYDVHNFWLNNTCDVKKTEEFCLGRKLNENTCPEIANISPVLLKKEPPKTENLNFDDLKDKNYENDRQSAVNLQRIFKLDKCYHFRIAHKFQPAIFAPLNETEQGLKLSFKGLACKTNVSLSILALDSLQYHFFAENLGIDILNRPDKSAVVILNSKLETHHVMQNSFSTKNLKQFIYDFTKGFLDRTLDSLTFEQKYTHHYKFENVTNKQQNIYFLQELNTYNFLSTIMQPDVAVIVMYYSTKCAFCSGISHAVLTTARMLNSVQDIKFARIDGDSNSLPWEYTMHHYPSILFFPTKRKADSRVFPQNVPITVPNILAFILANIDSNIKLRIMWTVCNQTMYNEDLEICMKSVRNECVTLIGKLLRIYRFSNDIQYRTALLNQLQHLRSLHFLLTNPLNMNEIQKHLTLLRTIHITPNKFKHNGAL